MAILFMVAHWSVYILATLSFLLLVYILTVFLEDRRIKRWLRKEFKQNVPAGVVIILPNVAWLSPLAWIRPNFHMDDIKVVTGFAQGRGKPFSVYIGPSFNDVERIMADKSVKEVYFVGHGGTHFFRLGTEEVLCYCAFSDPVKYAKDFVHQVHCGTPYGKSLIDYVVPEENRKKCFFIPKQITSPDIVGKFKELGE